MSSNEKQRHQDEKTATFRCSLLFTLTLLIMMALSAKDGERQSVSAASLSLDRERRKRRRKLVPFFLFALSRPLLFFFETKKK